MDRTETGREGTAAFFGGRNELLVVYSKIINDDVRLLFGVVGVRKVYTTYILSLEIWFDHV